MTATPASETQREPVPRDDTDELGTARAFLAFARGCVLKKLDGVSEADARRRLLPSHTTLLGLVQHLAACERYWIGFHVGGIALTAARDDQFFTMTVPDSLTVADVVADYRAACAASDDVLAGIASAETATAELIDDAPSTVRWVLAHVVTETTRHAGHADVVRELIDGVTGR